MSARKNKLRRQRTEKRRAVRRLIDVLDGLTDCVRSGIEMLEAISRPPFEGLDGQMQADLADARRTIDLAGEEAEFRWRQG